MRLLVCLSTMLVCAKTLVAVETTVATELKSEVSIRIDPDQLQGKLHAKNLRVLDVRSRDQYAQGHIPGALRVDVGDWKNLATAASGLYDAKGWTERVSPLGLTKEPQVVVYGSNLSSTARIWWLLKYVGVKNVSILDGGWEWWMQKGRPTEKATPDITATDFQPHFQAGRLAESAAIKRSLNSATVQLVDTRSSDEFRGGRIPGAAHLEWKELIADDGRFKTKLQLQQLFRDRGILPAETAVCY